MLERLLANIQEASGPISFDELSSRLQVERSALEPMLDLLVRRGLLSEWINADTEVTCDGGACGTSCPGVQGCPFVVGGLPRALEVHSTRRNF